MLLALVEGLTEYLPISSTGHLILSSWMLGIHEDPFVKDFTIMVQFGAILAVVVLYWRRFILNVRIYPQIVFGFLPAAVVGLSVKDHIDALLGNVWVVGVALFVGGILLVMTDRWIRHLKTRVNLLEELPPRSALTIGIFQCLAFIPGVSRSAATIWGGLYKGLSLELATIFSFFLAVPTLTGASFIKLMKIWPNITPEQTHLILWGNVASFVVGALAIKGFVHLVSRYGLKYFGYYRIILGLAVLIVLAMGGEMRVL